MSHKIAIVDDDKVFADTLSRRLTRKGLSPCVFYHISALLNDNQPYDCLLLDMNLGGYSSIAHLTRIREKWPQAQVLIMTGYASIASTVAAIKQGADDYLTKPLDFAVLLDKITGQSTSAPDMAQAQSEQVLSPAQLEWEHIQRVLQEHDGNISAAARALSMHRRTLQRKLQKKSSWREQ